MLTREQPYSSELQYLTEDQVLQLIKDKDDPCNTETKKVNFNLSTRFDLRISCHKYNFIQQQNTQ